MTERTELVAALLALAQSNLESGDFKVSVADVIRLLQMQRELEEERPREITVQWVEPQEG
jgi:hypothetical protein